MTLGAYLTWTDQSYRDFAGKINGTAPQVCRWIKGHRLPTLHQVARIHRATGGHVTAADWLPADLPTRPPVPMPDQR